ncbi:MAG: hypothetical protein US76_03145 [Parcubacteria group bacterium GW2011_GWA2_38_13b]|nr:MAG: hypothetical protein US76_03145 [Parcubacteria group bacterium GW2011_GWA2_38_13b]
MKKLLVFLTTLLTIAWISLFTNSANMEKVITVFSNTMRKLSNFSDPVRTWTELGSIVGIVLMVFLWTIVLMRKTTKK